MERCELKWKEGNGLCLKGKPATTGAEALAVGYFNNVKKI